MRVSQLLDRRAGYSLASLGLLLSMVAPAVIPAFASAAQLQTRSITMSTSATSATDVSYLVTFTAPTAITVPASDEGGVIIDFCSNTAVLGDSCTAPTGMDVDGSTLSIDAVEYDNVAAGSNGSVTGSANHIVWTAGSASSASDVIELTFSGITNPSAVGVFYARVTTYADDVSGAGQSSYVDPTDVGTYDDEGSMALAATYGVGITSYVLESMTFCVSGGDVGEVGNTTAIAAVAEPSENCGSGEADCVAPGFDAGCVVSPSMTMGTDDGSGNIALASDTLALGRIWAQLSSNATGNTVVNLKSDAADCGGLYRNGNPANCDLPPHTNTGASFAAGTEAFGLRVGAAAAAPVVAGTAGTGTGTIGTSGSYDANDFFIDFVDNDVSGVTSTYGSPIFSTTGAVDNMNVPITFGASIDNNTPAGTYGATFSLVAVGTF